MMKRLLIALVTLMLALSCAAAEDICSICGGTSGLCLTDEVGAVYCSGVLASYPEDAVAASYTIRAGTKIIGEWAYAGNDHVTEIILPEGVAMIDTGAFDGCNALQRVELPDSLLVIGDMAFYYCTNLTDVELPPRLYAIGPSAFVDCWKLTGIDIPETVRYIGSEAFCNTGLTEMRIRTINFEYGFNLLHPGYLYDPAPPVTIHMCDVVIEEELGPAIHFYLEYGAWENLTFVFDIPHFD